MKRIAFITLMASLLFFAVRIIPYFNRPTPGFIVAYAAGKMLSAGHDMRILYDRKEFAEIAPALAGVPIGDIYSANTPILPIFFLPFSLAPAGAAKVVWELFSLACVALSLALLYDYFRFGRTERMMLTALAFALTPLYFNFVWGQLYAFLLLLHVVILHYWRKEKMAAAGGALALLITVKGYGLPMLLLALIRREYRLIGWTVSIAALLVAGSIAWIGTGPWLAYSSVMTGVMSSLPAAAPFQQTLGSLVSWFFVRDEWNANPIADLPFLVRPLLGSFVVAGIVLLTKLGRTRSRAGFDMAFSAAIILNVITAPLLFEYHYTLLLIPILACFAYLARMRWQGGAVAFGAALLLLLPKIPYYDAGFQKYAFGVPDFPRVYGSLILLWICWKIAAYAPELTERESSPALEAALA
jgi:hypothetical protein